MFRFMDIAPVNAWEEYAQWGESLFLELESRVSYHEEFQSLQLSSTMVNLKGS